MSSEALVVAGLFLATAFGLAAVALRWRSHAPRLSAAAMAWAAAAYAVPALYSVAGAPVPGEPHEPQPYVMLIGLWVFLLVPSAALVVLGGAWIRARRAQAARNGDAARAIP